MKLIKYVSLALAIGALVGVLTGATHQWFMAMVAFFLYKACEEEDLTDKKSNN